MSQVLSIQSNKPFSGEALRPLLNHWSSIGSYITAGDGYLLRSTNGESILVRIEGDEIVFQGEIDDDGLSVIDAFAGSLQAPLLFEGEPLDTSPAASEEKPSGPLMRYLGTLIGVLLIPLSLVVVPLLVFLTLARLLLILVFGRRNSS